jgi:cysteinyl-tRNA synthetase
MLRLYNTLTRQTEEFRPLRAGQASVYSCGPTVYWFAHIGNMRAFLFADVLRRVLEYNGLDVTQVMNITDVGHLVGDVDEGEDKMLVAMRREGKTAHEIAEFYTQAFLQDVDRLNIRPASAYPRATGHIKEQIEMVEALEKNGFTYRTSDGIYFDTSKLPEYGRLSGQRAEEKLAGARVEMGEKRNATDFALWKFAPEGVKREMVWPSPWGDGFPGWHLECSAMSKKYLGVPFDIHTGGIDHIPVHHENEIAQTMGADGVLEANVWMHSEFITVDGGRMGKSLGNFYTIQDLIDRGYDPLAYRYLVLGAHYRSKLNFTWEALDGAQNALDRLRETVRGWSTDTTPNPSSHEEGKSRFAEAVNDDLNTPQALSVMWAFVHDETVSDEEKAATILDFDRVLGLRLDEYVGKPVEVPSEVKDLVAKREAARAAKDFAESDRLRDEIAELGFSVEDTSSGPHIRAIM